MGLSMKQKETHSHAEQTCGCQKRRWWAEEGGIGRLGLSEANDYIQDRKMQETLNKELYSIT